MPSITNTTELEPNQVIMLRSVVTVAHGKPVPVGTPYRDSRGTIIGRVVECCVTMGPNGNYETELHIAVEQPIWRETGEAVQLPTLPAEFITFNHGYDLGIDDEKISAQTLARMERWRRR